MATAVVMSAGATNDALDDLIETGAFDGSGDLILTTRGGSDINAGSPTLVIPDASTTVKGLVELATTAEAAAGTDTTRAITAEGLATAVPDSSLTVKGKVELATTAETITGTDATRAVTPAGFAAGIAATDLDDLSDVVITSPAAGHTLQHNGTSWVNAAMVTQESEDNASATTNASAYTNTLTGGTANRPGLTFKAPPSGKVLIHWSFYSTHSAVNGFAYMSFEIRAGTTIGSGTSFLAASDVNAIVNRVSTGGSDDAQMGSSKLVTGLTPGSDYNIQGMWRVVTAGTITTLNRRVIVQPVM